MYRDQSHFNALAHFRNGVKLMGAIHQVLLSLPSAAAAADPSLVLDLQADVGLSLSDNDPVALWVNQNGSGNNAVQANASFKPVFKATGGPGGRPCVDFVGGKVLSLNSAISLGAACTIFAVCKPPDGNPRTIIGGNTGSVQYRINGLKQNLVKAAQVDIASSSTNLSTSAFQQINMTWNGTTVAFRLSGAANGSTNNAQTITVPSVDIGAFSGTLQTFAGPICMIRAYNRVLSGGEITAEEAAILSHWGV